MLISLQRKFENLNTAASIFLMYAIFLYNAFILLDWFTYPDYFVSFMFLRFALSAFVASMLIHQHFAKKQYPNFYCVSTVIATTFVFTLMANTSGEGYRSDYYVGVIFCIVGVVLLPVSIRVLFVFLTSVYATYVLTIHFVSPVNIQQRYFVENHMFMLGIGSIVVLAHWYVTKLRSELKVENGRTRKALEERNEAYRVIREAFGRYLSNDVVESILKSPEGLGLGGENRDVTILITDLRSFTSISEQLKPEQVVQLLNSYFRVMFKVANHFGGTIIEISGDSLLVLFGAPQELSDRVQKAVACAIAMQNAMTEVNSQNRADGLPELEMGIGVNDAKVIVGNVGTDQHTKYGVVGSGVNMTSRIQSYTTGGQILVSDSVIEAIGAMVRIDTQIEVSPKGSQTPITVYEIGGIRGLYNLFLQDKCADLVTLKKQVPIRYAIVNEKFVNKNLSRGKIVRLSLKGCEVSVEETIDALANVKMNLSDVKDDLASKDIYGKAEKDLPAGTQVCRIRFTHLPPMINGYFQAILSQDSE